MHNRIITLRILIPLAALALVVIGATLAVAESGEDKPVVKGAWQPPEEDPSDYRDIIDYNIFNADRRRIADRVDRERNPPKPQEVVATTPDPVDDTPADPDSLYRLAGISHDSGGAIAYIEHTGTGELMRIEGPSDFSQGEITVIGYESLVYVVAEDQRSISIGQNLTGQSATPTDATASSTTDTGGAGAPDPGSREAILRAMRERREREFGNSQPAPPQPDPKPETTEQTPSDSNESSSGQAAPAGTRSTSPNADNQ